MPKINKEFFNRALSKSRFEITAQLGRAAGLGGYVPTSRVINADDPDEQDVQRIADALGVTVAELTDPAWQPPPFKPSPGRVSLFEVQERAQDFPGFAGPFRDDVLPDPHHWPLGSRRLTDDHGATNVDRLDFDWGEPIDVEGYPALVPSLSEGEADRLLASLRKQYDFLQAEADERDDGVSRLGHGRLHTGPRPRARDHLPPDAPTEPYNLLHQGAGPRLAWADRPLPQPGGGRAVRRRLPRSGGRATRKLFRAPSAASQRDAAGPLPPGVDQAARHGASS